MDPINYTSGFQNPLASFASAVQSSTAILDSQIKRDALDATIADRVAKAKLAAEARQAALAEQARQNAILQKLQQPGATFDDYMKASILLPKDQAEALQKAATSMKEEERKSALTDTAQIFSAFKLGDTALAASLIRKHGAAVANEQSAKYAETLAQMTEATGDGAKAVEQLFGYQMAAMPGGKDAFDAINKLETERRDTTLFPTLVAQKKTDLAKATTDQERNAIEAKYLERLKQTELAKATTDQERNTIEADYLERLKQTELAKATTDQERNVIEAKYLEKKKLLEQDKLTTDEAKNKIEADYLERLKQTELAKATTDQERNVIEAKYLEKKKLLEQDKLTTDEAKNKIELQYKDKSEIDRLTLMEAQAWALLNPQTRASGSNQVAEKEITAASDLVGKAAQYAKRAENLATAIDKAEPAGGWPSGLIGKGWEAIKGIVGGQDAITKLKQEYLTLRSNEAMSHLPPGSASDADMKLALEPFPEPNASPKYIADYMHAVARLQEYTTKYNKAKLQWLSKFNSMRTADEDTVIGDVKVNKGEDFWTITDRIPYPNVSGIGSKSTSADTTPTFSVEANGKVYSFPSQEQLDAFKKEAGI